MLAVCAIELSRKTKANWLKKVETADGFVLFCKIALAFTIHLKHVSKNCQKGNVFVDIEFKQNMHNSLSVLLQGGSLVFNLRTAWCQVPSILI